MRILFDSHLHTSFSSDSDAPMEDMVLRGIALGLDDMCFTEHLDLDYPDNPDGFTFLVDMDAYFREYTRLKETYAGSISLRFGIELGMQMHLPHRYDDILSRYPFDFVLASQHLVNGEDPYDRIFWDGREEKAVYRSYFRELYDNLCRMNQFDCASHLDYIVRYGPHRNRDFTYEDYADVIDPILELIIARGKALEVNSAGLRYGLGSPNPTGDILRRYRELGGSYLSIGSDAHRPEDIASHFDDIRHKLMEIGFTSVSLYRGRVRDDVPL